MVRQSQAILSILQINGWITIIFQPFSELPQKNLFFFPVVWQTVNEWDSGATSLDISQRS